VRCAINSRTPARGALISARHREIQRAQMEKRGEFSSSLESRRGKTAEERVLTSSVFATYLCSVLPFALNGEPQFAGLALFVLRFSSRGFARRLSSAQRDAIGASPREISRCIESDRCFGARNKNPETAYMELCCCETLCDRDLLASLSLSLSLSLSSKRAR